MRLLEFNFNVALSQLSI